MNSSLVSLQISLNGQVWLHCLVHAWALDLSVARGKYSPVLLTGRTAKVSAVWWLLGGMECKVPFWYRGYFVNQDLQIISDEIVLIAGGTRLYEECLKTSALTLCSPSQKNFFEKRKITSDKDKSQYQGSTWEIQQTKISSSQKWEQKIFSHSRLKC